MLRNLAAQKEQQHLNGTTNNNSSLSVSSSAPPPPPSSNNTATTTIAPCSSSTSSSSSSSSQGSTHNTSALHVNSGALNPNLSLNGTGSSLGGGGGGVGGQPPPMSFDYQQQFYSPFQGSQFGGQQLYSSQNQLDSLVYDKLRLLTNQSQSGAAPGTNFYAHNTNGNGFKLLSSSSQKQSSSPTPLTEGPVSVIPPPSTSPRSLWSQKLPCNNWYQAAGGAASPSSGFNFQQNLGLSAITGGSASGGGGVGLNGSTPSPGSAFNASGFSYQRMGFPSVPSSAVDQHAIQQQQQQDTPPHESVKKG